jgi:hypothetical protein
MTDVIRYRLKAAKLEIAEARRPQRRREAFK